MVFWILRRKWRMGIDDNGVLKSIALGTNDKSDEKIIIETKFPKSNNYKLMLWDDMNVPLIETIGSI